VIIPSRSDEGRPRGLLSRVMRFAFGRTAVGETVEAEILDDDLILRLQQLRLVARRASMHGLAGAHPSPRRIVAAEFADHRPYYAGDEVRRVDWNAYARSGELLVKRSQAQEHAVLAIFVDSSSSMDWGRLNKLNYGRQLAAAIAYVADRTYDRVRVVAVAQDVQLAVGVETGADGLRALLRALSSVPTDPVTDLPRAIAAWLDSAEVASTRPAGLAVLITDLLPTESQIGCVRILLEHGYEVTVIHVLDDSEIRPDLQGDLELVDAESLETMEIRAADEAAREYTARILAWRERIARQCASLGARFVAVETSIPIEAVVLSNLRSVGAVR
jgi:uncharacterized protein (DUF58 family)